MTATREALLDAFRTDGHELWTVGGDVRDRVLGLEGGDEDFATSATPDEVENIARRLQTAVNLVGQRFGTVGVQVDGRWTEITTFRGESYAGGSRWPDVTFGRTIDEDLARRDFTMNAVAVDAFTGERRDPFGGEADIAARTIRAVGEPESRFHDDPLRILRGLRFVSQLGFEVEPGTLDAMARTAGLLSSLSQERVTAELDKLLLGEYPTQGLGLLSSTRALDVVLPEALPMVGCEQNSFHRFDVWGHTVATVAAMSLGDDARVRRWAAFLHDIGKPSVRHRKASGEWGFYGHERSGAEIADRLLERLKLGQGVSKTIVLLVRRHMDRPNVDEARSVRRYMRRAEGHWRDLLALKRADNASHVYDDTAYHDALEAACERVERLDADRLRAESPLTGDDLVAMFGREPGPWIQRIKDRLSSMVLDGDLAPGDREAAESIARAMMAEAGG